MEFLKKIKISKGKAIFYIILAVLVIFHGVKIFEHASCEAEFKKNLKLYSEKVEALFIERGAEIESIGYKLRKRNLNDTHLYYDLNVKGSYPNSYNRQQIFDLMQDLRSQEFHTKGVLIFENYEFNGEEYTIYDDAVFYGKRNSILEEDLIQKPSYEGYPDYPYLGMLESEVAKTKLGEPTSSSCLMDDKKTGRVVNSYVWKDYKGKTTFGVLTANYSLTTKMAKEPYVYSINIAPERSMLKTMAPDSYSHHKSSSSSSSSDPYNANDFRSEEDFYDDNWEDFFDYEDAEDYFFEHNDTY